MRDIKGYKGLYAVSKDGRIWGYYRSRFIKPWLINSGYETVMLYKGKKPRKFLVHRLVAQTFIPNPSKLREVNHRNSNKMNNRVDNLEWVTSSQNKIHALKSGKPYGRKKLSESQVREIRSRYDRGGVFQKELAKEFQIDQTVISDIVLNRIWKHIS